MTQNGLLQAMRHFLKEYYGKKNVIGHKKFVIAKGDIPIAVCAHLDTVFPHPPSEIYYDREQNVIWSPDGAGHDDRAGVFMIMKLIEAGLRPHVIFTTDEEIGCIGSDELIKYECPFGDDIRYIIQLDRKGVDDCVFYWGDNREFVKYVESFGFVERYGSFTDIVILCPEWEISGVNLSVGYRDEHTRQEVLFVSHWFNTLYKVTNMLNNPPEKKFPYVEMKSHKWDMPYGYSLGGKTVCCKCKAEVLEDDVFPVRRMTGKIENMCIDCMQEGVNWCIVCNSAFETINPNQSICNQCMEGVEDNGSTGEPGQG